MSYRSIVAGDCLVLRRAFGIRGVYPATLASGDESLRRSVRIADSSGLRVGPSCGLKASVRRVALWPSQLEPWLPRRWRRQQRLAAVDPRCPLPRNETRCGLMMTAVQPGLRLHRTDRSQPLLLPLTSVAAVGPLRWYLDGKPQPGAVAVTLDSGEHELIAVDRRQGCLDRAVFSVE